MQNEDITWLDLPKSSRALAAALQFQLSQTQHWHPDKLLASQLAKVQDLLRHAFKHTPYYNNKHYKMIHSWKDWHALPVLSREEVQQYSHALRCEKNIEAEHGKSYLLKTSGSTGRPLEAIVSERSQWYWKAITLRDHLWHKRNFDETLGIIKYMNSGEGLFPGTKSDTWGVATGTLFRTGASIGLNSSVDINQQYQWLQEKKPKYLLTYPSLLKALAQKNLQHKEPISFNHISAIGETLGSDTRECVHRSFGCRIADIYSSQEVGYIALQCPKHDHYHIQSETTLVEILNEKNQPCKPGELGRVVVTPLHNYAMPLLRYEVGDYAILGKHCDCGINLPVIKKVIGRTRNLVTYPDGKKSWPSYNPMKLMEEVPGVQFQLIQKSLTNILLKIGTKEKISIDKQQHLIETINQAIGYNFSITIEQVDKIPRGNSGKYEEFLSEIESNV